MIFGLTVLDTENNARSISGPFFSEKLK